MGCKSSEDGMCLLREDEDEGLNIDTRGRCLGEDSCVFAGVDGLDPVEEAVLETIEDEENTAYKDEPEDPLG